MAKFVKLSVSLPKEDVDWARQEAASTDQSLSGVLAEALRRARKAQAMDRLLRKLGAAKLTKAQIAAIDEELFGK